MKWCRSESVANKTHVILISLQSAVTARCSQTLFWQKTELPRRNSVLESRNTKHGASTRTDHQNDSGFDPGHFRICTAQPAMFDLSRNSALRGHHCRGAPNRTAPLRGAVGVAEGNDQTRSDDSVLGAVGENKSA
jgi:hypothetical protein